MIKSIIPHETIANRIYLIRGKRVMLDRDLAALYDVETRALNQAVKRNIQRFPEDFMFQLNQEEAQSLRSQCVTLNKEGESVRGRHRKYLPYCFTEQGVAMLSSVLRSERAIHVNIAIMRVFVKLKEFILTHKDIEYKLKELERKVETHEVDIQKIFEVIRQLIIEKSQPKVGDKPKKTIGFHNK